MTHLGRLRPPETEDDTRIDVWCAFLPREIHPSDWLESWCRSQGYETSVKREVLSAYGLVGDRIATRGTGLNQRQCRLTAFKDADRVFLVVSCVGAFPNDRYQEMAETFLMAMLRFKLLQPTRLKFAEAMAWQELPGVFPQQFLFPVSWGTKSPGDVPPGTAGIQRENVLKDTVVGTLLAFALADPDELPSVRSQSLEKLITNGYAKAQERSVNRMEDTANGARWVLMRDLITQRADATIRISIAEIALARGGAFLMLLSPDRDTDFDTWAVNRRAFEIGLNTLRLYDGT